jgi:hypothetical protein
MEQDAAFQEKVSAELAKIAANQMAIRMKLTAQ